MSDEKPVGQVIQIDEARIRDHLGEMVRGTVEETLNAMLDAEADRLCGAALKACGRANLIFGSDNWQCHRLDARIVRIVGNVKAKFGAHDKHGRILRQHLASYGLEVLML